MSNTSSSLNGPGTSDNSNAYAIVEQARALGSWRKAGKLWSYMDEDLWGSTAAQISSPVSMRARMTAWIMRLMSSRTDYPRILAWDLPRDVTAHLAIAYQDDNQRAHYLDVFAPADAGEGKLYPVVIDDHGGGFVYGTRELNRSFAMHLAHRGYVVVVPSYRPGPLWTFVDILTDLSHAYSWVLEHGANYGADIDKLFLTGDSAGACMALHSTQIENSQAMSAQTGVPQAGLNIRGLLLVCGIYNLKEHFDPHSYAGMLQSICPEVFESVHDKFVGYDNTTDLLAAAPLPPVFINTSSDDFLHDENVDLAERLEKLGVDYELDDADAKQWGELGHVSVIGLATHERSQISLDKMDVFMRRVLGE